MKFLSLERIKLEASFWLGRRLPTCQEVLPVLSQSLERRLTLRERATLRLHFIICVYCVRYLKQLRFMREALRAQSAKALEGESAAAPPLPPDARERIRRALQGR
jgi:hypothetical protein